VRSVVPAATAVLAVLLLLLDGAAARKLTSEGDAAAAPPASTRTVCNPSTPPTQYTPTIIRTPGSPSWR